ncbi:hypothetical protein, unlikely [Trypanosoma brucei gambiense DAL972]|uniref:T. brucei spp.-specific protein n=1 Tax=Trypanosoma brucei gambiense (strain MHOM/CI/86/DAL972) TaxID=679716 RepID=C9ZRQ8_TRYB9|nr:hypothetical protein, unlikely [Trypanosoma brucei gambiense DAL972]CBH12044.1 hypothetical protein, unlikely [Trypanosoma brucei gambiense DAL972]|eukprot:XP_011774327.1 hypothetical protein, unlikely [Trypanosoma brucei gambiense DAL972]
MLCTCGRFFFYFVQFLSLSIQNTFANEGGEWEAVLRHIIPSSSNERDRGGATARWAVFIIIFFFLGGEGLGVAAAWRNKKASRVLANFHYKQLFADGTKTRFFFFMALATRVVVDIYLHVATGRL